MCSVSVLLSAPATELATVISRPSSTQATPRAITILVWNRDHGSRSTRAGIRLRVTGEVFAGADMASPEPPGSVRSHAGQPDIPVDAVRVDDGYHRNYRGEGRCRCHDAPFHH